MIMSGRTVWHLPIGAGRCKEHCPPDLEQNTIPAVFNRAGYATMRTCKLGQQLRGREQALHRPQGRHEARRHRRDRQRLARASRCSTTSSERETTKDTKPVPDLLRLLASARHARRHAGAAREIRRRQPHRHKLARRPRTRSSRRCRRTICRRIRFRTAIPDLRDEVAVSGVWEQPRRAHDPQRARPLVRVQREHRHPDRPRARRSSKRWASSTTPTSSTPPTTAWRSAATACRGNRTSTSTPGACPSSSKAPASSPARARRETSTCSMCSPRSATSPASPPPETNEGISFKPVLEGKQPTVRDVLYGVYSGGTKPGMRCVKKGDWKLIKYDVLDGTVRETQLFNLAENPDEFLAGAPRSQGHRTDRRHAQAEPDATSPATRATPTSSRKWKRCCSPKCAAWTIRGACGISRTTASHRPSKSRE